MSEENGLDVFRLQEELNSSEARFYNVVDVSPDGIVVIDTAGIIRFINESAQRLFGRSEENLLGQEFGYPLVSGKKTVIEVEILSVMNAPKVAEMRVLQIVWEEKPAFLASIRDISEHTRLANELNKANRELLHFSYAVSHDIKAPLRNVKSLASWMIEDYGDDIDERVSRDLKLMEFNVNKMLLLVDGLLQFTEIGASKMTVDTVPLSRVVDDAMDNIRADIVKSEAKITVGELPSIEGNSSLLVSLFQNLLTNSIKYHGSTIPRISINALKILSDWEISISDDGIGIEKKYWDDIFEPFKRLHDDIDYPGSGIGLASCKKIVEQHNGRVWLESEPGIGSTFYIVFPAK